MMREASERRRFGAWRLVRAHEKRRLLMMRMGIGYNICIERNPSRKKKTEYANETELKGGILRERKRWVLVRFRQSVELCGCHVGFTAKDGIFCLLDDSDKTEKRSKLSFLGCSDSSSSSTLLCLIRVCLTTFLFGEVKI